MNIAQLIDHIQTTHPHQIEFHQATSEVLESLEEFIANHPIYQSQSLLERMVEPERVIMFRVTWIDDT